MLLLTVGENEYQLTKAPNKDCWKFWNYVNVTYEYAQIY